MLARMPSRLLYGTAWKEDETERLVRLALRAGFRDFDTANQRKHYHEAAVGSAIAAAIAAKEVRREDLFLQTKFTSRHWGRRCQATRWSWWRTFRGRKTPLRHPRASVPRDRNSVARWNAAMPRLLTTTGWRSVPTVNGVVSL